MHRLSSASKIGNWNLTSDQQAEAELGTQSAEPAPVKQTEHGMKPPKRKGFWSMFLVGIKLRASERVCVFASVASLLYRRLEPSAMGLDREAVGSLLT